METQWTEDRFEPNDDINEIRGFIARWRATNYDGVTSTTRELLEYWSRPDRERPLFFAQRESVETAVFLTEVASKEFGGTYLQNKLRDWAEEYNPGLLRAAFKMATGAGKTTVMGMLVAWHTLNKAARPQDRRFGDAFLVVAPGITIKDRLRVLLPNDPDNVYRWTGAHNGRGHLLRAASRAAICSTSSCPSAAAMTSSTAASSSRSTVWPLRSRKMTAASQARRLLPSTRAWLRTRECSSAAALSASVG